MTHPVHGARPISRPPGVAALLFGMLVSGCIGARPALNRRPGDASPNVRQADVLVGTGGGDVSATDQKVSVGDTAVDDSVVTTEPDGGLTPDVAVDQSEIPDVPHDDVDPLDTAIAADTDAVDAPSTVSDSACQSTDVGGQPDLAAAIAQPWVGIVGTGQSLSVGAVSGPVLSTVQPYNNLKLSLGCRAKSWPIDSADPALSIVPLVEPLRVLGCCNNPYPADIFGETYHTAMASQLSALHLATANQDFVTVHTEVGIGGASITLIQKNGTANAYEASLFEVAAITRLATLAGTTYTVGAVVLTHGEADAILDTYQDDIVRLWDDYNHDIPAITGQTTAIPMIVSQQAVNPDTGRPLSPVAVWKAGVEHPGQIICSGPKYQYTYVASDHLHLIAPEYDRLGEKYAQVFYETVVLGHDWQPLQPISATVGDAVDASTTGQTITIQFHVPVLPLMWDPSIGLPHQTAHTAWTNGRGFEVEDSQGEVTITAVAIQDDTVIIDIDRPLVGTTEIPSVVRYALTQDATTKQGGLPTGRIGQLCDSDPFVGVDAATIAVTATNGSATIRAATAGGFAARSPRTIVEDTAAVTGLPPDTLVRSISGDTMVLTQPWAGATGTAMLRFRANHRNYAVSFELPLAPSQ